jgi:glycosyltransferase involved in cell wall biosynthesis
MIRAPACSIIITNYNYGRFLGVCIDSALNQTAGDIEVIVVDDGSTDGSRELIAEYGDRITAVLKVNGGQASAFNAGFAASTGDVIIFLDADDMLASSAVETALPLFEDRNVVKVHWPLHVVDERGCSLGRMTPDDFKRLPEGDLREAVLRDGPTNRVWPPTSGNAWSRRFLHDILPMEETAFGVGADNYLFELAPFYGVIRTVRTPQSFYRLHDQNTWATLPLARKLEHQLCFIEHTFPVIARHCESRGWPVDLARWRASSWWCKLGRMIEQLDALIPRGQPFILVDEGSFGLEADIGRHAFPFPARDGHFWGSPADDESAIAELGRRADEGITAVIVAWPAFWYLDYFKGLRAYLDSHFQRKVENECFVAFLRQM